MSQLSLAEQARLALQQLGIAFTKDAFVEKAGAGDLSVVKLFVQAGMDIDARGKNGVTALIWAARCKRFDVAKYLVSQGADLEAKLEAKTDSGWTALIWAAWNTHSELVKFLVSQGADVNATDDKGGTVLHSAAVNGHLEVVKYLVERGADVSATDNAGRTARYYAEANDRTDLAEYLLQVETSDSDIVEVYLEKHWSMDKVCREELPEYRGQRNIGYQVGNRAVFVLDTTGERHGLGRLFMGFELWGPTAREVDVFKNGNEAPIKGPVKWIDELKQLCADMEPVVYYRFEPEDKKMDWGNEPRIFTSLREAMTQIQKCWIEQRVNE